MRLLICLIFGHTEWRPNQLLDFHFIGPTDPTHGEQWEVCMCGRCKLLFWRLKGK